MAEETQGNIVQLKDREGNPIYPIAAIKREDPITENIPVSKGGTGVNTFNKNSVLIGNGTNPIKSIKNSLDNGGVLLTENTEDEPKFATVKIKQGGTGRTTFSKNNLLIGREQNDYIGQLPPKVGVLQVKKDASGNLIAPGYDTVPIALGGTSATTKDAARANLGAAAASHTHPVADIRGVLPVSQGGTGASALTSKSLLIGGGAQKISTLETKAAKGGAVFKTSPTAVPTYGTLPIGQGGTNATSEKNARANLGTDNANNITKGMLQLSCGGTGVTSFNPNYVLIGQQKQKASDPDKIASVQPVKGVFQASGTNQKPFFGAVPSHNHAAGNITSGTLSEARGGTGRTTGAATKDHKHAATDIASGTLSVGRGGTGVTSDKALIQRLGKIMYPVGSYYITESTKDANQPASIFGGTWKKITAGQFLRAVSSSPGGTGGSATHTHNEGRDDQKEKRLKAAIGASNNNTTALSYEALPIQPGGRGPDFSAGDRGSLTVYGTRADRVSYKFNHYIGVYGWTQSVSSNPPYRNVYIWLRTSL